MLNLCGLLGSSKSTTEDGKDVDNVRSMLQLQHSEENGSEEEQFNEATGNKDGKHSKGDGLKSKHVRAKGSKSTEDRFRHIFERPPNAQPKHPILSSPFARRIAMETFEPRKPKWFKKLSHEQFYLFKELIIHVESGRLGSFSFREFIETLQDIDSTVAKDEVKNILQKLETGKEEEEELDFGKFLFLLAYGDQVSKEAGDENQPSSRPRVTRRQSIILSSISSFFLNTTAKQIDAYYSKQLSQKSSALFHQYLDNKRLEGLTDDQMELRQNKINKQLSAMFERTGIPYAHPVPFVPSFKNTEIYKHWKKGAGCLPKSGKQAKPVATSTLPVKYKTSKSGKVQFASKSDREIYLINTGKTPPPHVHIPHKLPKVNGITMHKMDYITMKVKEVKHSYRDKMKEAAVEFGKQNLKPILKDGFPTDSKREKYIKVYQTYLPLQVQDLPNFSLWVEPEGFGKRRRT